MRAYNTKASTEKIQIPFPKAGHEGQRTRSPTIAENLDMMAGAVFICQRCGFISGVRLGIMRIAVSRQAKHTEPNLYWRELS